MVYAPEIGYRFRPMNQGIGFQVTWAPLFNTADGAKVAWFGSLGALPKEKLFSSNTKAWLKSEHSVIGKQNGRLMGLSIKSNVI